MICKFFENKKGIGGGIPSVNYLLNKQRVRNGTAKILKGDENLTREIIKSLDYKQKACVGCLSFEEKNIDENLKKELMQSFENALLTPQMQGRYNILWVEHTDKGRLELNFVIPKIDLESKKAFNPYFHKIDFKRVDLWGDLINLSYDFTNPKDPAKTQSIKDINHHAKTFKDHKALDNHFKDLAIKGLIKNKDELINYIENDLKDLVEITRKGKDYLGLKLPNDKKATRYKGEIYQNGNYADTFREENQRKQREARELSKARDTENIAKLREKLDRAIEYKANYIREKHKKRYERNHIQHAQRSNDTDLETSFDNLSANRDNTNNSLLLDNSSENVTKSMGISQRQEINNDTNKFHRNDQSNERILHRNAKGLDNEPNREHLNTIAERKRRAMQRKRRVSTSTTENERREQQANARARELNERKRSIVAEQSKIRERNSELERATKEQIRYRISNTTELRKRAKKLNIERIIRSFEKLQPKLKANETKHTNQQRFREKIRGLIRTIQDIANRAIKRANNTRNAQELYKRLRTDFSNTAKEIFTSSGFRIERELKKPERQRLVELKRQRHRSMNRYVK